MTRRHDGEDERQHEMAELEAARPYLELARQIRARVDAATGDDTIDAASLVEAIEAVPRDERQRVARAAFDRLGPTEQWAVLARAFGDEEIRTYLAIERNARLAHVQRTAVAHAFVLASRETRRLDLAALPADVELTLGLFLPGDARAAVDHGRTSSTCARQLVVRSTGDAGVLHVIEDRFNPRHGLFVTPSYDEAIWARTRLDDHAQVRIGSCGDGPDGPFEAAIYPAGRVDVEHGGAVDEGPLHLGFAVIGEEDVYARST